MMRKTLELLVKGKDEASSTLSGVGDSVSRLGTAATNAAIFGIAAAGAAIVGLGIAAVGAASKIAQLTVAAAEVESVRNTFENLTESLGGSEHAMELLQEATRGMVSEAELMQGANKFLAMGLADSAEEAAQMAEMATQLGMAMGEEAGPSMENFALMLANQSIPRLDSFAISSGKARDMINAMMEANEGLTREQAFANVVMELGAEAMAKVGEQGETAAAGVLRWQTSLEDLKLHIGQAFIPILELLQENFQPIIDEHGPKLVKWAEEAADWLGDKLPLAMLILKDLMDGDFSNAFLNIGALVEDAFGTETALKFVTFGKWLDEKLPIAAEVLVTFIIDEMLPALDDLKDRFDNFSEDVMPATSEAWEILLKGWEDIVNQYNTQLKPALDDLTKVLGTGDLALGKFFGWFIKAIAQRWIDMQKLKITLLTAVIGVAAEMVNLLRYAFIWLTDAMRRTGTGADNLNNSLEELSVPDDFIGASPSPFELSLQGITGSMDELRGMTDWAKGAFASLESKLWGVQNVLKWVRDWIDAVATSFRNLDIPDWLRPGSPAPLETALLGIGKAFDKMPQLSLAVTGSGGMGGMTTVSITNHFGAGSVRSDADILAIADTIQRSLELQGVRGRIS